MTDTCVITRRNGDPVTGTNGQVTQPTQTIYTGKCYAIKGGASGVSEVEHAGEPSVHMPIRVSLPWAAPEVEEFDLVQLTASADPTLLTRTLRVMYQDRGTHVTARRLFCEETP